MVPEVKDESDAQPMAILDGRVSFEKASFSYGRQTVLHDINFEVERAKYVALLGATGSGKSTIISSIPRFYDPTAGRILVDGVDIRKATLYSLRSQIGIVLQETTLFAAVFVRILPSGKVMQPKTS